MYLLRNFIILISLYSDIETRKLRYRLVAGERPYGIVANAATKHNRVFDGGKEKTTPVICNIGDLNMGVINTGEIVGNETFEAAFMQLREQRLDWESKELKAAHDRLYSIIARTYHLYITATHDELKIVADKANIPMTKATTDALVVAKLVFGVQDKQRASAIKKVLEAAKESSLTADEVSDWIKKAGGIEAIRVGKTEIDAKPSAAETGRTKATTRTDVKFTIPSDAVSSVDPDKDGFLIHVSRRNATKDHDVLYVLNEEAVLNAVFAAIEKAEKTKKVEPAVTPAAMKTAASEVSSIMVNGLKAAMTEAVSA